MQTEEVEVNVTNNGPDLASGTITLTGFASNGYSVEFTQALPTWTTAPLTIPDWVWTAATGTVTIVNWTATVTSVSGDDSDPSNDTATARTRVARR